MKVEIPNQLLVKVSGMISRGIKEAEINEEGILVFTLTDGTKIELGSVKGDQGPRGESGVYVGTGEMPEGCNVQIDPSGEAFEFIQPPKTASIGQALLVKSIDETGKPTEWETGEVTGGTGGTNDHSKLSNRDAADQHPIGAITGLEAALDGKQPAGSYLTEESDPTVPAWAKEAQKPSYTAQEVGADPSGTAAGLVSAHNTAEAAHNDIRLLISGLTQRLNALADSDDTTLDQLSEVVAYIKANRELIASITTDKVSVTDIVNDLVTNVTNKPLSAAQGVALKALIDAITIPTALPNPNALTFTGAVNGSYDGSEPVTVNVPSVTVDDSLTKQGQAADAAKVGEELSSLSGNKVSMPTDGNGVIQNGTDGQILQTNGDGTTQWVDKPTGGSSGVSGNTINQYFYNSEAKGKYDMKDGYGITADIYIAADGTETAISGLDYVATDYIPVSANTTYVAYCNGYALYDSEKTFVSAVIDRSNYGTIKEFTPEQDGYARITYRLSGDGTMRNFARLCEKSEIKKAPRDYMPAPSPFFDIRIPCNVDLYGDSNSYGYGLSDTANAWSNRLGALLLSMPEEVTNIARCEMSVFAGIYSGYPKLRNNGVVYMSAYTDKFTVNGSYITAVDVYIDGVQQEQMTASLAEYACTLGFHEIELRGRSGANNIIESIVTNKKRTFTNHAVTGSKSGNLPLTVDGNVEIVMYGTNDRETVYGATADNMARFYSTCEAAGAKVYFCSPIPTKTEGETNASYKQTISDVISQIPDINYIDVYKDMQLYSLLSAETLYSDKLHLNDLGHKVLYCIVASKLHLAALNSIFDG